MDPGVSVIRLQRLILRSLEASADCLLVALTYIFAVGVRTGGRVEDTRDLQSLVILAGAAGVLQVVGNIFFQVYWRNWSLAALEDLGAVLKASALPAIFLLIVNLLTETHHVPNAAIVTGASLVFLVESAVRLRPRWPRIIRAIVGRRAGRQKMIVVGAGATGQLLASHMLSDDVPYEISCFVDDDTTKQRTYVRGIRVSGRVDQLPALIRRHRAALVVIAMRSQGGALVRRVIDLCEGLDVNVRAVSGFDVTAYSATPLRTIAIEELMEREPVRFESRDVRAYLDGRVVLVTGAAGSIGSEICRQVLGYRPARLLLLDTSESGLHDLKASLQTDIPTDLLLADVRDRAALQRLFESHGPNVVFHAAAYKHVPILEQSPLPGIATNVLGTWNVLRASVASRVDRFVFISSDKAVTPINVLGITKRIGELLTIACARQNDRHYAVVRFGNVLGSVGSVIPIFNRQLDRGGPLTVTHPEATRYFMTIEEAAGLVIEAGGIAEQGDLLVLDMGTPVLIRDLALKMIRLRGLRTPADIQIEFVGLRPGEKMHEDLFFPDEVAAGTQHPRVLRADSSAKSLPMTTLLPAVQLVEQLCEDGDEVGALRTLRDVLSTVPHLRIVATDAQSAQTL
jgi:FlaA1/EpsC-like NDP-sugar epimerase